MCNWQWLYNPAAPFKAMKYGANLKDDKAERLKQENMARSQALQDQINAKTKELQSTLGNETPVITADRVLNPNDTKKQTIKSLNIPLNSASSGTGLNI